MTKHKLPKGIRKYIRLEKARIRRVGSGIQEEKRQIEVIMKNYYQSSTRSDG